MVDQTTRGHQFILKNFGADAAPRATWQIDPFGHSNTQAWLLGAEAGFDSFFWGRMDWQDRGLGLVLGLGLAQLRGSPQSSTPRICSMPTTNSS